MAKWREFSGMIEMDNKGIFMKLFPKEKVQKEEKRQQTLLIRPRILKKCMSHQPTSHIQQEAFQAVCGVVARLCSLPLTPKAPHGPSLSTCYWSFLCGSAVNEPDQDP